jgi:hypothetical protein
MLYGLDIKALAIRVVMLWIAYVSRRGCNGSYETAYHNMLCIVPLVCSSRHWEKKFSIPAASSKVVTFETSVEMSTS